MTTQLTSTPAGKAQKSEISDERTALLFDSSLPHISLAVRSVCAAGHFQQAWVTVSGQIQPPGPISGNSYLKLTRKKTPKNRALLKQKVRRELCVDLPLITAILKTHTNFV